MFSGEGVILGRLQELKLEDGRSLGSTDLRGCYLAWVPSRKDLVIVHRKLKKTGKISEKTADAHREFHAANPSRVSCFDWSPPKGVRVIGRLQSLIYDIPKEMRSPEKKKFRWDHAFGDHGERGHGPSRGVKKYSRSLMPKLCEDRNGDLFIVRVPGNKYYVRDWILY